jgi:hypothetical protein
VKLVQPRQDLHKVSHRDTEITEGTSPCTPSLCERYLRSWQPMENLCATNGHVDCVVTPKNESGSGLAVLRLIHNTPMQSSGTLTNERYNHSISYRDGAARRRGVPTRRVGTSGMKNPACGSGLNPRIPGFDRALRSRFRTAPTAWRGCCFREKHEPCSARKAANIRVYSRPFAVQMASPG